jgi:hypothetical protein
METHRVLAGCNSLTLIRPRRVKTLTHRQHSLQPITIGVRTAGAQPALTIRSPVAPSFTLSPLCHPPINSIQPVNNLHLHTPNRRFHHLPSPVSSTPSTTLSPHHPPNPPSVSTIPAVVSTPSASILPSALRTAISIPSPALWRCGVARLCSA